MPSLVGMPPPIPSIHHFPPVSGGCTQAHLLIFCLQSTPATTHVHMRTVLGTPTGLHQKSLHSSSWWQPSCGLRHPQAMAQRTTRMWPHHPSC